MEIDEPLPGHVADALTTLSALDNVPASSTFQEQLEQGLPSLSTYRSKVDETYRTVGIRFIKALTNANFDLTTCYDLGVSIFTIIVPKASGYVTRSDFLRVRLEDCPAVIDIYEKPEPLESYDISLVHPGSCDPGALFPSTLAERAPGIVQWADMDPSVVPDLESHLLSLNQELKVRLDLSPWLSPHPIARKTLALVRGRPDSTAGDPIYSVASALGIDIVVVDEEGHWVQEDSSENRRRRKAFLATDMTEDEHTADRIIDSLKKYNQPVHGIFTCSDNFLVDVAKVADALDLPGNPVSSFEISVDKCRSRLLQDVPGQTACVKDVAELEALLAAPGDGQPPALSPSYPVIVKPSKGWSSECVSKVSSPDDLATAVQKATELHGSRAVIEPFFDGPEIDVNFILRDGDILFCEIADEPPCDADARDATVHATFSPVALNLPSALPQDEQEIAKTTLRDILVKAGFHTGVFHVEARMVDSRCEYRDVGGGVVDLVRKQSPPQNPPSCRLLEINARPAGYRVSVPARHTYGVDYFAAHMLAAAGDHDRLRMLARPFRHTLSPEGSSIPCGAQYFARLVYVPAPAAGTLWWHNPNLSPCAELMSRRTFKSFQLTESEIVLGVDYNKPGDRVEMYTNGVRTYVAHLLVASRRSRYDAIRLGDEVARCYRVAIEPPPAKRRSSAKRSVA
ncbi:hypothetical protein B0T24DRAFT_597402 [Lasiosphaeria ovina]|uniref:ATP-grasp domain-containing protein n=1 Tax=Lasiosphaeria ovina TaxID=92902 RepID=A0AAE0JWH5_9PEZI|nr:hypothetical protein B0T24DRAFT_597402 [Lasiosphaeria ovina]